MGAAVSYVRRASAYVFATNKKPTVFLIKSMSPTAARALEERAPGDLAFVKDGIVVKAMTREFTDLTNSDERGRMLWAANERQRDPPGIALLTEAAVWDADGWCRVPDVAAVHYSVLVGFMSDEKEPCQLDLWVGGAEVARVEVRPGAVSYAIGGHSGLQVSSFLQMVIKEASGGTPGIRIVYAVFHHLLERNVLWRHDKEAARLGILDAHAVPRCVISTQWVYAGMAVLPFLEVQRAVEARAATIIQQVWLRAYYDPSRTVCKRRIARACDPLI